jgi:uroporphyrinogen-III decarboxylase
MGFDYEASCKRICSTYRREKADRVVIIPPIPWQPYEDIDSAKFRDWRGEAGFRKLAKLVQNHCDPQPPYNKIAVPSVFEPQSYQRFLEAPQEYVESLPAEKVTPTRLRQTTVLHTPKGDLSWIYEEEEGSLTRWDRKKPVECEEDVERLLSVPYRSCPPDPTGFAAFRQHRDEMGSNAISGGNVNCMVAMLCGIMSFELLLEWVVTRPELIKTLADTWLARTGEKVDWLLSQGVGPYWHFNGVERASPPMMGPKQWDQWVVPYDGEIMRRIKSADPHAMIHVHCHGRVRTLLDSFVQMGVDSTDPVEPPPQGDTDFAEVTRLYGDKLVFFGNIEILDMETSEPDEIETLVRKVIENSGKNNVVLMPSAWMHERPTDRFLANAERYIEAGVKYG